MKSSGYTKCYYITPQIPFPVVNGGVIKTFNTLKILAKHFELEVIIISNKKPTKAAFEFYDLLNVKLTFFYFPIWKFLLNGLIGTFRNVPIQASLFYFNKVHRYVLTKDDIDRDESFFVSHMGRTAMYLDGVKKDKYLDLVDSLYLYYSDAFRKTKSFHWRILYRIEAGRLKMFEAAIIKKVKSTFFVNWQEANYWKAVGNTVAIPNGVKDMLFNYNKFKAGFETTIVFLGAMDYQPNVDAIVWFVENVWHLLKTPLVKLMVIGGNPTGLVRKLSEIDDRIIVTGYLDDPYEIINSAAMIIAPMQTGAGIQNKVLEAMALGKMVVATSYAALPLELAKPGQHLMVEDNPGKMADLIDKILSNPEMFDRIGPNARQLVMEKYTWDRYENELLKNLSR